MNEITPLLIEWYAKTARDLPWRNTRDPYHIWLSEIVLQQTQVKTGLKYYERILSEYPDVYSLAGAGQDKFMKLWQGLGYYRRADNLLKTAKFVVDELEGKFPTSYSGLLKLKGVGRYTAAAVASFAYDEPVPVIDGNVRRVVSRLFDVHSIYGSTKFEKQINEGVSEIFSHDNPALFNQAIMEFGALQCRKVPQCESCPLIAFCLARKGGSETKRPLKKKGKGKRLRRFCYLLYREGNKVALVKRGDSDIWRNLYEFPCVETNDCNPGTIAGKIESEFHVSAPGLIEVIRMNSHILSHQEIYASLFLLKGDKPTGVIMVDISELYAYPVHRLMEKLLHDSSVEALLM